MMSKQLYTYQCLECNKVFHTDNIDEKVCPKCQEIRQPHYKYQKKKSAKKPLTFAQILHIADVYNKIHHRYLHYGDIVNIIESNVGRCVCCGVAVKKGKQICPQCERMVN